METRFKTIEAYNPEAFDKSVNEFCKNKKVFATQTHVLLNPVSDSNLLYIACIYYEYDEQLANEKPPYRKSINNSFLPKPNNSPEPTESDNFVPASSKQVFSLVKNYGYSKEAAEKLSMKEAYQIIKEKKGKK